MELVHGRGLALFTWGSRNNSYDSVDRQREMGVDGIIYDRCVLGVWLGGCGTRGWGVHCGVGGGFKL